MLHVPWPFALPVAQYDRPSLPCVDSTNYRLRRISKPRPPRYQFEWTTVFLTRICSGRARWKFQVEVPLKTTYGGLKDADRIFTNIYGDHDWHIDAAIKRVRPYTGSTRLRATLSFPSFRRGQIYGCFTRD
jgi:hypothetical protein